MSKREGGHHVEAKIIIGWIAGDDDRATTESDTIIIAIVGYPFA